VRNSADHVDSRSFNANSYFEFSLGRMEQRLSLDESVDWLAQRHGNAIATNQRDNELIAAIKEAGIIVHPIWGMFEGEFQLNVYVSMDEETALQMGGWIWSDNSQP
jgi:hypothetical protein